MTRLSVIIVNYNVKYFLEQALFSVYRAIEYCNFPVEVWVVDNASADGSCEMIQQNFPQVHLIRNEKNTGFSIANNQAIKKSAGDYVLLLNPDTIVEEKTFQECFNYMEMHPQAGALGVKMLDGRGGFLPESKRGLPDPATAFYKMFGIASLFPKSKRFGKYHLSYLDKNEIHKVEVLSGAFMFLRRKALEKSGLLDEAFFMYGEDIDLSYRLLLAGFENIYFPETTIIHFKGESTKKGSLNYVLVFYQAMLIFAKKHFSSNKAGFFSIAIHLAVFFRAILSLIRRTVGKTLLPLFDAGLIYSGFWLITDLYATNVKEVATYYPPVYFLGIMPAYIAIWLTAVFFSGGYDDLPGKTGRAVRGVLIGALVIALFYAFLDEDFRFSRALILLGSTWAIAVVSLGRLIEAITQGKGVVGTDDHLRKLTFVGTKSEIQRAQDLLIKSGVAYEAICFFHPSNPDEDSEFYSGILDDMEDQLSAFGIDEIVFCAADLSSETLIFQMEKLSPDYTFKILSATSDSIIGSNSKDVAGDLYALDVHFRIGAYNSRRNKRVLDISLAFLGLLAFPVLVFFLKNPVWFFLACIQVFIGLKTWVGYAGPPEAKINLPKIRNSVFPLAPDSSKRQFPLSVFHKLNRQYARNYTTREDLRIFFSGLKNEFRTVRKN